MALFGLMQLLFPQRNPAYMPFQQIVLDGFSKIKHAAVESHGLNGYCKGSDRHYGREVSTGCTSWVVALCVEQGFMSIVTLLVDTPRELQDQYAGEPLAQFDREGVINWELSDELGTLRKETFEQDPSYPRHDFDFYSGWEEFKENIFLEHDHYMREGLDGNPWEGLNVERIKYIVG